MLLNGNGNTGDTPPVDNSTPEPPKERQPSIPIKRKRGRPAKKRPINIPRHGKTAERNDIDPEQVKKLARLGCLNTEIADFFICDETTIRRRFAEILSKARSERKAKLRELQWRSAESGNVSMQIWLGKNELGQADQIESTNTINGPLLELLAAFKAQGVNP